MKKDILYSVLKILLLIIAALDAAYLGFAIWQLVSYFSGAVLTLRTYAAVSLAALALNVAFLVYLIFYLKMRRHI